MPASNKTPNFALPQYVANDHFSVLGDFNTAMSTIDENLGESSTQASSAATDAKNALTAANAAQDAADAAKVSATNTLTTAASAQAAAKAASEDVASLTTRVSAAESAASGASSTAASASSAAQSASQTAASANAAAQNAVTVAGGVDSKAQSALDSATSASSAASAAAARLKYFTSFGGSPISASAIESSSTVTYYDVTAKGLTSGYVYTVEGVIRAKAVAGVCFADVSAGGSSTRAYGAGNNDYVSFPFSHSFVAKGTSEKITVTLTAGSTSTGTADPSYSRLVIH